MPKILILDAPYYEHISKLLVEGAEAVLKEAGATWEYQAVPGVLEIPAALSMIFNSSEPMFDAPPEVLAEMDDEEYASHFNGEGYDGFITLGCVIRGETTHYDIVAFESARAIMRLTVDYGLALGNGIQTVENEAQALARARPDELNKGGHAAKAVLDMIELRKKYSV